MHKLIPILGLLSLSGMAAAEPASEQVPTGYALPHIQHENFGIVKIVVPLTSAEPAVLAFKLANINNAIEGVKASGGSVQAEMVLYGASPKLLVQPDSGLRSSIDRLRAAGVRFKVCNNSLKALDLNWRALYQMQETDVVPSGFLEVGWRANQGWAVEAMN